MIQLRELNSAPLMTPPQTALCNIIRPYDGVIIIFGKQPLHSQRWEFKQGSISSLLRNSTDIHSVLKGEPKAGI